MMVRWSRLRTLPSAPEIWLAMDPNFCTQHPQPPPFSLSDRLLVLLTEAQYSPAQHVVPQAQEVVELATLDANGQLDSKSI